MSSESSAPVNTRWSWLRHPSAGLIGLEVLGPGVVGGVGVILGIPVILMLVPTACVAGFLVAYRDGSRRRESALAGAGSNLTAFLVVAAPFVPTVLTDSEFRLATLGVLSVVALFVGAGLGFGALLGAGGALIARDLARSAADRKAPGARL